MNSDLHFRAFSLAVSGLHPLDVVPRGGGLSRVSPQPVHTLPVLLTPVIVWGGCLLLNEVRGKRRGTLSCHRTRLCFWWEPRELGV